MILIDFDDRSSWPSSLTDLLDKNKNTIDNYFQEERKKNKRLIDEAANLMLRMYPPSNQYQAKYKAVLSQIKQTLQGVQIIGYHCTRLTQEEIDYIKTCGLNPLTSQLVEYKLALSDGFTDEDKHLLRSKNQINSSHAIFSGYRSNRIWFIFSKRTLKKQSAIERFLLYWGGEAMYLEFENEPSVIKDKLSKVGLPVIIKAKINLQDVKSCNEIEKIFLNHSAFEGYLESKIPAENILDYITKDSPEFKNLTT